MHKNHNRRRGMSLVEILVVIGVLGLLIGLLVPSLSGATYQSKVLKSQSNMRQLATGLMAYSASNEDEIISPNTERQYIWNGELVRSRAWVNASPANLVPAPGQPGTQHETPDALKEGFAAPFIGDGGDDGGVFRSPLDLTGRIRSYSLNGCISRTPDLGFLGVLDALGIAQTPARTLGQVKIPDRTMFIIPEDHRGASGNRGGYNLDGWVINFFEDEWIDPPAYFAKDGINLAYIDGHVDFYFWHDPQLPKNVRYNHTYYGGEDHDFMTSIMMPQLEHLIGADG